MIPAEYQELAMRTAKPLALEDALVHAAMGLISDFGEMVTIVKAARIYGKPLDRKHLVEELGDCLWFIQYAASITNNTFERVYLSSKGYISTKSFDTACLAGSISIGRLCANIEMSITSLQKRDVSIVEAHGSLAHLLSCLEDICRVAQINLWDEVAPANIEKLRRRYPSTYTDELAITRLDKSRG